MSGQRTDRVWMVADEPRCEPEYECSQRLHCARYLAALPLSGARMFGKGLPPQYAKPFCTHFVPVGDSGGSSNDGPAPKPYVKGLT